MQHAGVFNIWLHGMTPGEPRLAISCPAPPSPLCPRDRKASSSTTEHPGRTIVRSGHLMVGPASGNKWRLSLSRSAQSPFHHQQVSPTRPVQVSTLSAHSREAAWKSEPVRTRATFLPLSQAEGGLAPDSDAHSFQCASTLSPWNRQASPLYASPTPLRPCAPVASGWQGFPVPLSRIRIRIKDTVPCLSFSSLFQLCARY
jgi:hypothetical protein